MLFEAFLLLAGGTVLGAPLALVLANRVWPALVLALPAGGLAVALLPAWCAWRTDVLAVLAARG